MHYPTPVQFDKEDKVIGGRFTLRQFVYGMAGVAAAGVVSIVYWLFAGRLDPITIIALLVIFGTPGFAMGALSGPDCRNFGGGPLDRYIVSVIRFRWLTKTWPPRS